MVASVARNNLVTQRRGQVAGHNGVNVCVKAETLLGMVKRVNSVRPYDLKMKVTNCSRMLLIPLIFRS